MGGGTCLDFNDDFQLVGNTDDGSDGQKVHTPYFFSHISRADGLAYFTVAGKKRQL